MLRPFRPRSADGSGNVLLGIARLARGRAEGIEQFGNTVPAFLGSLAPLIAFPLVAAVLMLTAGRGLPAITDLLGTISALLAPAILSEMFARHWQREALWLRFATAFNWCQWAIPVALMVLMLLAAILMALGLPQSLAGGAVFVPLILYGLWLHWFIARSALDLSAGRAALLVAGVNLMTGLLVMAPDLIASLAAGGPLAPGMGT